MEQLENKARYDYYRLYRVHLETEEHVQIFQELEERSDSVTFYGHARHPDQDLTIMIAAHKIGDFITLLERYNVSGVVLVNNLQEKIDEEAKTIKPIETPGSDFGWENYYHLSTIYSWLDDLLLKYPNQLTAFELGKSYNGVTIRGVKISHKAGNKAVFIESGIHAREWIAPATATFILNQLLTSNDTRIKNLATSFDWYIVPVLNVDGYIYTFKNNRLWRKNRKPYGIFTGVDLNRNFDSNWNGNGSSSDTSRYDFAGSSPESEPEAKLLAKFIREHNNINAFMSLHSFSQLLMFPYGHTDEHIKNYDDLKAIGEKAIEALKARNGTEYSTGSIYETIYPSSGGSMDWAYGKANIPIAYTFELRGAPDSTDMFILPADQIIPTGEETLDAFIVILEEAKTRGYFN